MPAAGSACNSSIVTVVSKEPPDISYLLAHSTLTAYVEAKS